jgi:hypothetical protein
MNLYSATIRADVEFASKWRSNNVLILCDGTKEEATTRATNFFIANGKYVKTAVAGTTPRLIEVREIPLTAMVYNGKLVENPEKYLKRAPEDSADLQKTIEGMSAAQVKERCDKDPEFKKLLDEFRKK